jgi:hypothetical protein
VIVRARRNRLVGLVVGVLAVGCFAPPALAADSMYWTNYGSGAIRAGNLDGSGSPQNLGANYTSESHPEGVAIDPARGKIYWADVSGAIRVGNLDGSGTPQNLGPNYTSEFNPEGVAIDPARGKIYWADAGSAIRVGNLDGSGAPQNLGPNYAAENQPFGVAIDSAAGKIYWTDGGSGTIRVGNLDGSGTPQNLGANYTSEDTPYGVAIDPARGKIYWANYDGGAIRVGNLNGSGSPQNLGANYTGENGPGGVAIDPARGKIYWTDYGSGAIRVGNLDGSGTPQNLGANYAGEGAPLFLALLRSPVAAGAPLVSGGSRAGSALSCSQGGWAADLPGAQLYHAPQRFIYGWTRDGAVIPSATSSTLSASAAGEYVCYVAAVNHAGISVQASAAHAVTPTARPTKTKIKGHTVTFKFTASAGTTGYRCALIKTSKKHKHPRAHFKACKPPKTYKHLKPGKYTFEVTAQSVAGAGTPASKSFKIH